MTRAAALAVVVFVQGPTNSGKSTFLRSIKEAFFDDVCLIEVGKIFRAKYPPEYFEGQAAPAWTQEEAIKLVVEGIQDAEKRAVPIALVDGQPRDVEQAKVLMDPYLCQADRIAIELRCAREEREKRARKRDAHNPAALALSLARMDRDMKELAGVRDVFGFPRYFIDTDKPDYDPVTEFMKIYHSLLKET